MKVIKPGHRYELPNFENPATPGQTIQFVEKYFSPDGPPDDSRSVHDGVTTESVLEMLIDRMYFQEAKFSCRENTFAIMKLEEALMWLDKRTLDRHKRGVIGKNLK